MSMFDAEFYIHKIEQLNRERILRDGQSTPGRDTKRKPHQQDLPESPCLISEKENFYPGSDVVVHAHRTPPGEPQRKPKLGHYHDFYELAFVYRGKFINEFPNHDRIEIDESSLILLNPYAVHLPYTQTPDDIVFNILLRKSFVESKLVNMISDNKIFFNFFLDSIYGNEHITNFLVFKNNQEVSNLILSLIMELCDRQLYFEQVVNSYLVALFAILVRIHQQEFSEAMDGLAKNRTIADILSYIRYNYSHVSLAEVAEHFNYSIGYMSRLIKQETSMSFSEIVSNYRLEIACNYLKNSNISTEKITEIIGYSDTSYFYKAFKKQQGFSPIDYRKRFQKNLATSI